MHTRNYTYIKASPVWYNGCYFHSKQELKFALSIEETYHYIREPIYIPFDPHTKLLPESHWSYVHFYVPDFLIRHKQANKAFLVEIKPDDFADHKSLALRKKLVQQFICRKEFDWQYKLVNENEIQLTENQFLKYLKICNITNESSVYIRSYYTIVPTNHQTGLTNRDYVSFLMNGFPPV
ncbi:MAG: hypothetical protein JWN76_1276 [Chitinophagaceae bacterium]|nr:hypothetical protein [Chitinophagaceae bacterium]